MARKRRGQAASGHEPETSETQQQEAAATLPPKRTTAEINFAVLSRYIAGLQQIIDIAPFTVLYIFSAETRQWEKCGIEGSLFVCQTWKDGYQGFSVVILNRKSLNNFIVDITGTNQVELTEQYVILQGVEEDGASQIYGVWIFSEEGVTPSTKDRVGEVIQGCAFAVEENQYVEEQEQEQEAEEEEEDEEQDQVQYHSQPNAPSTLGNQQLDLNALFSKPQSQAESHILEAQSVAPSGQQLNLLKLFGGGPQVQQEQHMSQPDFHMQTRHLQHSPQYQQQQHHLQQQQQQQQHHLHQQQQHQQHQLQQHHLQQQQYQQRNQQQQQQYQHQDMRQWQNEPHYAQMQQQSQGPALGVPQHQLLNLFKSSGPG